MPPSLAATVGLRIDVDTYRGTRDGVPSLLGVLKKNGILASFFFSLGPDNMGRHLWRLLRPQFLQKMLRSGAPSLYGWDILLRGTFWPGPNIGRKFADLMRRAKDAGHEVGIHAWDHHAWQMRFATMTDYELDWHNCSGVHALERILGDRVECSACAGWQCNERVLLIKEKYPMRYNSDSRGSHIYIPVIGDHRCTPQIPVTLPTYDELIGRNGITDDHFNAFLLEKIQPDQLNVLAIHAEVEGIAKAGLFEQFIRAAGERGIQFGPLGDLLPEAEDIPVGSIGLEAIPGREGLLCVQRSPTTP